MFLLFSRLIIVNKGSIKKVLLPTCSTSNRIQTPYNTDYTTNTINDVELLKWIINSKMQNHISVI